MLDAPRMAGEEMRRAIFAQPEWLRGVPTDRRLPEGRVLHTGCGTSFHAAQTGGWAEQALELVAPATAGGRARRRQPRGRHAALARGRARVRWAGLARHREAGQPARGARRRGAGGDPGGGDELVPHGQLHLRRGDDRRAARGGRVRPAGRSSSGRSKTASRSASTSASSSPAPGGTGRPRRRRC